MNKKKVTFWLIIAAVVVGLLLFIKFNPLYATFEAVIGFGLGGCAEAIGIWTYNKWVKDTNEEEANNG